MTRRTPTGHPAGTAPDHRAAARRYSRKKMTGQRLLRAFARSGFQEVRCDTDDNYITTSHGTIYYNMYDVSSQDLPKKIAKKNEIFFATGPKTRPRPPAPWHKKIKMRGKACKTFPRLVTGKTQHMKNMKNVAYIPWPFIS